MKLSAGNARFALVAIAKHDRPLAETLRARLDAAKPTKGVRHIAPAEACSALTRDIEEQLRALPAPQKQTGATES